MKSVKYQTTVKVLLSKYKGNGDKKFAPVYFNSATKTVINSEYMLDKLFQNYFRFCTELVTGLMRDLVG